MSTLSIPPLDIAAIDAMDQGMDLLRVVWLALHSRDLLTEEMIDACANTLNDAVTKLVPVREALHQEHGQSDPVRMTGGERHG